MSIKPQSTTTSNFEKVLDLDPSINLLIPVKWKSPYQYRKKDYLSLIIGLSNNRYVFERIFLSKVEFEKDEDEKKIGIGYHPHDFQEGMILEERYSFKKNKSFVVNTTYYKITCLDDGIYGEKLNKTNIKEEIKEKQDLLYERFKELINDFGKDFVLYSMKSLVDQKKMLEDQKIQLLMSNPFLKL